MAASRYTGNIDPRYGNFEDEEPDYEPLYLLNINVKGASIVDQQTKIRGIYCVIVSDEHGKELRTGFAHGYDLRWEHGFQIQLPSFPRGKYLYVELVRVQNRGDPGTSTGVAVVGRARIPLVPNEEDEDDEGRQRDGRRVKGRLLKLELTRVVGTEKTIEGVICLQMEIKRTFRPLYPMSR